MSWSIQREIATFCAGEHEFHLQLNSPQTGIDRWRCFGNDMRLRPLKLTWPGSATCNQQVEESYFRGEQLVVTYRLGPHDQVHPQVVWGVRCEPAKLTLDVTIAMQTSYLASNPSVQCETDFPVDAYRVKLSSGWEVSERSSGPTNGHVFLFRLPATGLSYAEMVFPPDLESPGATWRSHRLSYRVMCEPLEKGVIRKARVRAIVTPQVDDEATLRRAFDAFLTESPPLTT